MSRGGLYLWRTRKPWAVFGLPIIGRHFGYGGRTSSFYHREGQHLGQERNGGSAKMKDASKEASWSDLSPKCYRIPFPDWMSATPWRRKNLVEPLETVLIALTCPVYNVDQQPPWNLRKIDRKTAAKQRAYRDAAGSLRRIVQGGIVMTQLTLAVGIVYGLIVAGWL